MPQKYNRRSIRLVGYDYSLDGLYFITICTKNRLHQFGEIINGEMILNDNGKIALQELKNTEKIRNGDVILHSHIVMPNHVHFILQIVNPCRGVPRTPIANNDGNVGVCNTPLRSPSKTVGSIVRGYKCSVSHRLGFSVWQRNYFEHIIRTSKSYEIISNYILSNPLKWDTDCMNVLLVRPS
ncbi:MAG: transposase [Bacteroidales bacterium]|nr:transposase [Bacteroidales bacterium]